MLGKWNDMKIWKFSLFPRLFPRFNLMHDIWAPIPHPHDASWYFPWPIHQWGLSRDLWTAPNEIIFCPHITENILENYMSPGLVGMFLMSLAVNNRWVVSPCPLVSMTPGHLGGAPLSPSCQHCQCEEFIPTQIMKTSDWEIVDNSVVATSASWPGP